MGRLLQGKRFITLVSLLGFSTATVLFLGGKLFKSEEKRLISPLVSTEESLPKSETSLAERVSNPFLPFKKLLGFKDSSKASANPTLSKEESKTSLVRDYLSKAADSLGQVLGIESETSAPSPAPTATPAPTPTSSPTLTPTSTISPLTDSQKEVKATAESAGQTLVSKNYSGLYDLMGEDFKSTYSEQEFLESIGQGQDVTTTEIIGDPEIFGSNNDWGKVKLRINSSDGTSADYVLITHKEEGLWKIFGTEEA